MLAGLRIHRAWGFCLVRTVPGYVHTSGFPKGELGSTNGTRGNSAARPIHGKGRGEDRSAILGANVEQTAVVGIACVVNHVQHSSLIDSDLRLQAPVRKAVKPDTLA